MVESSYTIKEEHNLSAMQLLNQFASTIFFHFLALGQFAECDFHSPQPELGEYIIIHGNGPRDRKNYNRI